MTEDEHHIPVTSVAVARRAGVSQSAVSLVFGGKATGRVGKETQEAILRAARELDYHPNRAARTLRSGRSHLVVLAVPDVSNPYFAAVLQGAEQAARAHGYAVMLASVRDTQDWEQVVLDALASRAVDGFLFFTLPPAAGVQTAVRGRAVLVDASSDMLPSLCLDIEPGWRIAMHHLLHLGHTKIAHLAADVDAESFHMRAKAYRDALQAAGLPVIAAYEAHASFSVASARQAAHRLLAGADPPTAIVCDSDVLAVGVYKAATDLHRAVPQDVSVVGFDDSPIAQILEPELTTVAIPTTVIGEQALLLLLAALANEQVPSQTIVPLELVIRASTAGVHP